MSEPPPVLERASAAIVAQLGTTESLAVAESLTGGLVAATIVETPGASNCFRAGICTYATDTKHTLLGVDAPHLARRGPVNARTALEMAVGVARVADADWGLSTTGVAGPGPDNGIAAGTTFIATYHRATGKTWVEEHHFPGARRQVREAATLAALELLALAHDELQPQ